MNLQEQSKAVCNMAEAVLKAIAFKQRAMAPAMHRAVSAEVYTKQFEETERDIEAFVAPLFNKQIEITASRLKRLAAETDKSAKTPQDSADSLVEQIFDPNEWMDELIDRALPPLALHMVEAMNGQMDLMGVRKAYVLANKQDDIFDQLPGFEQPHTTTASEWLAQEGLSLGDVDFNVAGRTVSMGVAIELPLQMKMFIKEHLIDTFAQDYWQNINQTTKGDIRAFLARGIRDGQSIETIAKNIIPQLHEQGIYARRRARNIARTESGHALNGARVGSIDSLFEDLAGQVSMQKVWLSVLGNTTRDTHAVLDGVPANKEGFWTLAGIDIRWPADIHLPPSERCNCQCTVVVEFGMTDSEAEELIGEYFDRIASFEGDIKHLPGQHSQSSHGHGKGGGKQDAQGNYIPGVVGKESGVDTSGWSKTATSSQNTLKKIAKLEELAEKGDWDTFHKKMSKPKTPPEKWNIFQKSLISAQENLLKKKGQKLQKPPPGVNQSSSKPSQIY